MDIKLYEAKKIITSPIVIALTSIFILFNFFLIFQNSYIRNDLKIINNIIEEFGYEINDETIESMDRKSKENLDKLNDITLKKFNKSYNSIDNFFVSKEYESINYKNGVFTEEEFEFLNKISLLDMYVSLATDLVDSYETIDIRDKAKYDIKSYGISGRASEIAMDKYKELEKRFDEIKESNQHKNLFFFGRTYQTHNLLYRNIISSCIYEIMILVVLITSYLVSYEFDNKTSLLVYSTKRGRKNAKDKLLVSIVSSIIISIIILGITLIAYFIVFDYSNMWNIPISSAFNWDFTMPYISWFDNTIITHMILSIIIVLVCSVIFASITFIISKLIKNNYIVFFIFFIVFGINLIIPSIVGTSSGLIMYLQYDVFNLILNPHMWFMEKSPLIINKYYELITLSSWIIIIILGSLYAINRFKKQDIS